MFRPLRFLGCQNMHRLRTVHMVHIIKNRENYRRNPRRINKDLVAC